MTLKDGLERYRTVINQKDAGIFRTRREDVVPTNGDLLKRSISDTKDNKPLKIDQKL
jgi:hypothetical protein